MENQETNQETFTEMPPYYSSELGPKSIDPIGLSSSKNNKPEKTCKTCAKQKVFSRNNIIAVGISISVLFLAFYGLIELCKDVASLFTR